jgi:sirohydrochlorin ferrochelatase
LVEPGFLELMRPTFEEGVACLVDQGATSHHGGADFHGRRQPREEGSAAPRGGCHGPPPGLLIELAAPVGEADSVLAAMADYAMNAQLATAGRVGLMDFCRLVARQADADLDNRIHAVEQVLADAKHLARHQGKLAAGSRISSTRLKQLPDVDRGIQSGASVPVTVTYRP